MEHLAGTGHNLGIPNLEVRELIGGGGFSKVYRGYDSLLKRELAVKILRPVTGVETRAAFENEAGIHGPLSRHPNIVTIHHAGFTTDGSHPFLVMDLVKGGTLREYVDTHGAMAWQHAVGWMLPVCTAVQHTHDKGVLHRDIKPDNILLDPPSTPLLSDLGIACLDDDTSPSEAMTFAHVAPEAIRGARREFPSDVFSLGSTLYQLVAGHPPFGASLNDRFATLDDQPPALPPDSLAPAWLSEVLGRALAPDPAARIASASQLATALQAGIAEHGVPSQSVRTPPVILQPVSQPGRPVVSDTRLPHPSSPGDHSSPLPHSLVGAGLPGPSKRLRVPRLVWVAVASVALFAAAALAASWAGADADDARTRGAAESDVSDTTTDVEPQPDTNLTAGATTETLRPRSSAGASPTTRPPTTRRSPTTRVAAPTARPATVPPTPSSVRRTSTTAAASTTSSAPSTSSSTTETTAVPTTETPTTETPTTETPTTPTTKTPTTPTTPTTKTPTTPTTETPTSRTPTTAP